VAELVVIFHKM